MFFSRRLGVWGTQNGVFKKSDDKSITNQSYEILTKYELLTPNIKEVMAKSRSFFFSTRKKTFDHEQKGVF